MNDLVEAAALLDHVDRLVAAGVAVIAQATEEPQVLAYDVAHAASAVLAAREMIEYGRRGEREAALATAFVADVLHTLAGVVWGREESWGVDPGFFDVTRPFVARFRSPSFLSSLGARDAPVHLDDDFALVRDTFRRFATDKVRPHAEHVHRTNADVPEEVIAGLAEIGGFGLSIPEEYGGFAGGSSNDYLANVVATEELSRASLGIGGSLLTRPEILTRALVRGGTEDQKRRWLPPIAAGETLVAIAVTEPDYGSDVAGVRCGASRSPDGSGWVIDGTKTWCTFAARADALMLLARTDPSTSNHRGLAAFVVPKPRGDGHGFAFTQDGSDGGPGGGSMEGRAIDTIGYRGMHSYEISFDGWWVPDDALIGGDGGLGRGFYLQMEGFENGRLQTAARAVGLMQAAYEAARDYAESRVVFGRPIADYELTKVKLARMNVLIAAGRQLAHRVAQLMSDGGGALEASMAKAYICRAAEWVTREALQIHGGMGYAEEYAVSRYYVDARVLSIFEGADETLCLKVIARRLVELSAATPKA